MNARTDILDADGENRALRSFLMQYSCDNSNVIQQMRDHMRRSGWDGCWPDWVETTATQHLTKAGAQLWIRHLLALEVAAKPAPAPPPEGILHHALQEQLARDAAAGGLNRDTLSATRDAQLAIAKLIGPPAFQQRVKPWMMACFGEMTSGDREERNHRFLEEALELVQACGCSAGEAHQLVDYVFGRPVGEKPQEVGGVMVTLAALCLAHDMDMHAAGDTELARVWTKIEAIRAKQATKPKYGPLPGSTPAAALDIGPGHECEVCDGTGAAFGKLCVCATPQMGGRP